ncbi:MAG: DUF5668 domain-containing protein [Bacteroidota bacterium]
MNNSNRNYISAGILILLGLLFLGRELNILDFHWGDLARFWPVLLILIGINIIFGGKAGGSTSWIFFIIFLLAIPFGVVRHCENNWDHHDNGFRWNDKNWNHDNENDHNDNDNDNNDHFSKSQSFSEEMTPAIKSARLVLEGGVAGIDIDGTTTKLFEADTKSTFSDFSVSNTVENGTANVRFTMKNRNENKGHVDIDTDNFDGKNEAKIKLNPDIEWNMEYKFGVSGADLDLSPFNVKSLDIKTGVSGVDIKLGDKANDMQVDIDAGIAGINLKVPNGVGVRIKTDSFLSGNNFEGFTKDASGYYISPDYNKTTNKITVNYKGAFASFDVDRY